LAGPQADAVAPRFSRLRSSLQHADAAQNGLQQELDHFLGLSNHVRVGIIPLVEAQRGKNDEAMLRQMVVDGL
jgi:hypothetical protein